jgi:hypothetical protein
MNFLTNINLNGNKLEGAIIENAVIQNVGVDPSSLKEGQIWYNSSTHQLKYAGLVEGVVTPIIVGEGEVSQEELNALNKALGDRITALESSVGSEESGLVADVASANNKADEAKTTAATAASDAATAKSDAANAVSTANNASSTAAAATSTASAAQTTANEAKTESASALTKATSAETTANEAKTAAENAQTTANSAQAAADGKVTKVVGIEDNIILFGANGAIKDSGKKISDIGVGGSGEVDTSGLISKVSGAVEGNLPSLATDGSLVDSGYSVKGTLLSERSTEIPTSNAVALYVTEQLSGISQGIVFRGVINNQNEVEVPYNVGDMYYIGTAGTYFGYTCEIGDVLIAKVAKTNEAVVETTDWSVLESNKDVFKGASTELAGSSGLVPAPEIGVLRYLDSTGAWTAPVATRWSGSNDVLAASGGIATWNINHGLGRKDVQVVVYEVINDYEYNQVMCNVTLTGNNYCNVIINTDTDIEAGKYFAVVM